jgi:exonuclease V
MTNPAANGGSENSINDDESDYGSEFSPEEEEILLDLVSGQQQVETEDNPIVPEIEHDYEKTLRIPRTVGRESKSPLFQAARAAEEVAEQINRSVRNDVFSDCKILNLKS